jgi:hypothetical protein
MNAFRSLVISAMFPCAGFLGVAVSAMPLETTATQSRNSNSVKPEIQIKKDAKKPKPGTEKAVRAFMRQKLKAMRSVLQGIVTEDFLLIRQNAEAMKKMGTQAEWNVVQGPIYGNHSRSFQRSTELLSEAAKEKNADSAMLVYMQMTLNCIDCHRYTREPNVKKNYQVQ